MHAVEQMQARAKTAQLEVELFHIDDQIMSPFQLSKRLTVRINYRWRSESPPEWTHSHITFKHEFFQLVDYSQMLSNRKSSAVPSAQEIQDKLFREWEHMKILALCSLRISLAKVEMAPTYRKNFSFGRRGTAES